jgi:hypothetical protein
MITVKNIDKLVKYLVENYTEFSFLKKGQETVEHLNKFAKSKFGQHIDENISVLENHMLLDLKHNFYTLDDQKYFFNSKQSQEFFDYLISLDLNLKDESLRLKLAIEKSIADIHSMTPINNELKLIQFLDVDQEILSNDIYLLILEMINQKQKNDLYTFNKTRLKLTNFCYKIGHLYLKNCLEIRFRDQSKIFIKKFKNSLDSYNFLYENQEFIKNFNFIIDEEIYKTLKSTKTRKKSINNMEISIKNITTTKIKKETYKVGQDFYEAIKGYLLTLNKDYKKGKMYIKYARLDTKKKLLIGSIFLNAFQKKGIFMEQRIQKKKGKKEVKSTSKYAQIVFVPKKKFFPQEISSNVNQRPYFTWKTLDNLRSSYSKKIRLPNATKKEQCLYNIYHSRFGKKISHNLDMTIEPLSSNNATKKVHTIAGKNYFGKNYEKTTSFMGALDKNYFYSFLVMLQEHIDIEKNSHTHIFHDYIKKHAEVFLLYKIKPEYLISLYDTNNSNVKNLLDDISIFALNFDKINDIFFMKKVKKILKPTVEYIKEKVSEEWRTYYRLLKILQDLYSKIASYKIFIRGLLIEGLIYCRFDYFIINSFIDTRGRHYFSGFYLNPNSYHLVKAFVKPFVGSNKPLTKKLFSSFSKIINKKNEIFDNKEIVNLLKNKLADYNSFTDENESLKISYVYELFENSTFSFEIFKEILLKYKESKLSYTLIFKESLLFVKTYVKSIKLLYMIHSAILSLVFPENTISNYYALDATASGLQMTSMVLRDRDLGELCNVSLPQNNSSINKDIYVIFSKDSSHLITNILEELKIFDIPLSLQKTIDFYYPLLLDKKLEKNETNSLLFPDLNMFFELLCENDIFEKLDNVIRNNNWLLFKSPKKAFDIFELELKQQVDLNFISDNKKKYVNATIISKIIIFIKNYFNLKSFLKEDFPWFMGWLSSRDVFKKAIMTFGYNATSFRRKEYFKEALLELNNYQKDNKLYFMVQILERIFYQLKETYLKSSQLLRDFGIVLSNGIKETISEIPGITIDNGVFMMKLKIYKKEKVKVQAHGLQVGTWHELITKMPKIEIKNNKIYPIPNYSLLARKFAPNFIHSMDAWVVCVFKYKIAQINYLLRNKIFLNQITNHDTFGLTIPLLLKYILMDIYKTLYFFDYLGTLEENAGYNDLIRIWYDKVITNNDINKLQFRKELIHGSPASLYFTIKKNNKEIKIDAGASTFFNVNPFFVK